MKRALILGGLAMAASATGQECSVQRGEGWVALSSPAFVFRLDTTNGLRAEWLENRLTGERIALDGPELEADIGLPDGPTETLRFRVAQVAPGASAAAGECVFRLQAEKPGLAATVTYRWNATEPVLHKLVEISNEGLEEINRLLQVRLGTYRTEAVLSGGEPQAFPVYANGEVFLSLAHPAGWATQKPGEISLRHYPGAKVPVGGQFACMETVIGVGRTGAGREAFLAHLKSRMRRTVRGHDRPYAIFEPFGGRANGDFNETEEFVLDMIGKVAEGQRESGCRFDLFSVDFWVDYHGDLKRCDPERFPNDLARIREALQGEGIGLGLWIDSSMCGWSIGGNEATHAAIIEDAYREGFGNTAFCRATEPIRSMYTEAFRHHIRENGARLLKFDNLRTRCDNPRHEHLPGIYSTEAIVNAVIECFQALDRESPDVFLMGYWGYRSPWWLLYLDTFFETGIPMEAASPGDRAAPYARSGVTRKLDQGHVFAKDVPWLGTDSLGVWLSHWGWNSQIGPEQWQDGFVMDICRGNMLAQPWSDPDWLTPEERRQMGEFIALLKARPECFGNSRLILGDPWEDEAYGYCCTDGQRAFLAINNFGWEDRAIGLQLNPAWGLPAGRQWDLYRWHPDPAQLTGPEGGFADGARLALRPFEVTLLEVVPHGDAPTLGREFTPQPAPTRFSERSRPVAISTIPPDMTPPAVDPTTWKPVEILEATSRGGATLAAQADGSVLASGPAPDHDTYSIAARTDAVGITAVLLEALPDDSLPGRGPGRAENGNFMLNGLRLSAGPEGEAMPVALTKASADYEQTSYGGWPASAAIDGDAKTGWSIDPCEGMPHVALFEVTRPFGQPGGTALTLELDQGERGHSLGRFRLWATSIPEPQLPTGYGRRSWQMTGQVPQTRQGGMLAISVELLRDGKPLEVPNLGSHLSLEGTVAGEAADFRPALGQQTYPSSWQSWRLDIEPGRAGQPFELTVQTGGLPDCELRWTAHFIPRDGE